MYVVDVLQLGIEVSQSLCDGYYLFVSIILNVEFLGTLFSKCCQNEKDCRCIQ